MNEPAISVLMTVYNAGRFLDPSIRSILGQTFRNFEFLIVDDASTDGSVAVIEEFAAQDARIRFIQNEANKGQTPCLNQGLRLARGKWIARQDADDLSHGIRLFEQYQYITMHPELVLLGTNGRIIDEHDRLVGLLDAPIVHEAAEWTSPFLNPFMHTSVLFRADIVREEFGGYDESYRIAQDFDLWTRILARHRTGNLAQRLVCYRHLNNSLSKAGRGHAFAEAARVAKRESERVFRQELNPFEEELLARFREGLDAEHRTSFWRLYRELLEKYQSRLEKAAPLAHTVAMHHLKAAGSLSSSSRASAVAEIFTALRLAPRATVAWLAERYLGA